MARGKGKNKAGKATVEEVPDEAEVEVRTRREKAVEENAKLREIMGIGRADISKAEAVREVQGLSRSSRRLAKSAAAQGDNPAEGIKFITDKIGPPQEHNDFRSRKFSVPVSDVHQGTVRNAMKQERQQHLAKIRWIIEYLEAVEAATIHIETTLEELRQRPRSDDNLQEAKAIGERLAPKTVPEISTTCQVVDSNGERILVYIARHTRDNGTKWTNGGICPMHRNAKSRDTQSLFYRFQSALNVFARDTRHAFDQEKNYMAYQVAGHTIMKEGQKIMETYMEMKGLRHDCLMWSEQGHPERVHPSAELLGKCNADRDKVIELMFSDFAVQNYIGWLMRALFPVEYEKLRLSCRRANWATKNWDTNDPAKDELADEAGIFMNHVSLWKLTAEMHRDWNDYFCVIFCDGKFSDGQAVFPDLNLKFSYKPGDIILFYSDALYHAILPWVPGVMTKAPSRLPEETRQAYQLRLREDHSDIITPGRVSWVLSTHKDMVEKFTSDGYEKYLYDKDQVYDKRSQRDKRKAEEAGLDEAA